MCPSENVKKYYLCSDVHQFQKGTIQLTIDENKHTIHQFVVGIGGTECDEECITQQKNEQGSIRLSKKESEEITKNQLKHTLHTCKRFFGYLKCSENKKKLLMTYIPVMHCDKQKRSEPIDKPYYWNSSKYSSLNGTKKKKKGGTRKHRTRKMI